MTKWLLSLISLVSLAFNQAQPALSACNDGWTAPPGPTTEVRTVQALESALRSARAGDTILLADGDYSLRAMIDINVPNLALRGSSGDRTKVVLHGRGMVGDAVGVALSISAPGVTIADLTIRDVGYHAIQVRGERGASNFTLHNARLLDTGQQLLKGSVSTSPIYADNGLVACSDFSYTTSAPSNYTNGVDLLGTKGWVVRDNRFSRIRGPAAEGWAAGPTILVWKGSEDTTVERNVIVDSFRGIALGLGQSPAAPSRNGSHDYDHLGGVIRNNVIVNLNNWADEAIEANAARDVRIEHNTVLVFSLRVPWSISVRFAASSALVRNNLSSLPMLQRNNGQADFAGNVIGALPVWFADVAKLDFHLSRNGQRAVDVGVPIPDLSEDFDRGPRVIGNGPDAGAFESNSTVTGIR